MSAPVQVNEFSAAAAATTVPVAQGSNPTVGNTNCVWVRGPGGATVTSVADTLGHTYTARGSVIEAGTTQVLYQFTAPITSTGANTVTATYNASTGNRGIVVLEQAGTYDASNTGTDTGNNPTTAVAATNTAQPATAIMLCNDVQGGTPGVGTGFTNIGTGWATLGLNYRLQYKNVTTVASQSGDFANAGFDRTNTGLIILVDLQPPVITAQPTDQTANDGGSVTFSVTATGATSYQWQDDSGGSFANISGATSSTYNLSSVTYAMQGRQHRCNVTNGNGTTTSSVALLRVAYELSGTGTRSYPLFGGAPFGAGTFGDYLRGTASNSPTGTFASTLAGVTMAASGSVLDAGAFASTLAGVTMAASGAVAVNATGTFSSTLAGVTLASTGVVLDPGAFASVLAGITMASSGQVTDVGAFASTLAGVTMASAGLVDNRGSFASTLGGVTMAASGSVAGAGISGAFASTLDGSTMASSGQIALPGLFASTLAGASMASAGIVGDPATGTFGSTLGGVSMFAAGFVGIPPVSTGNFVQRKRQPRHVIALP